MTKKLGANLAVCLIAFLMLTQKGWSDILVYDNIPCTATAVNSYASCTGEALCNPAAGDRAWLLWGSQASSTSCPGYDVTNVARLSNDSTNQSISGLSGGTTNTGYTTNWTMAYAACNNTYDNTGENPGCPPVVRQGTPTPPSGCSDGSECRSNFCGNGDFCSSEDDGGGDGGSGVCYDVADSCYGYQSCCGEDSGCDYCESNYQFDGNCGGYRNSAYCPPIAN